MAGAPLSPLERLLADGLAHHRAGRLAEAAAAYRNALAAAPGHPAITHNLAVVLAAGGDHAGALALLDAAIAAEPGYAAAHFNRAVALAALGRGREAREAFARTVRLEPGHYEAHRVLGFLWLAEGALGRALDHFARTAELRRGEDRSGIAQRSLERANAAKIRHDAAQFRHIAAGMRDGKRFEMLARCYETAAREFPETATVLDAALLDLIGEDYNTAIHVSPAPERADGAVAARDDAGAIARTVATDGIAWFDGLLAPAALAALRRFLLESTIWHDFDHIDGFLAAYLEDGLASPLLLQIADELRARLPDPLGPHPLSQAWAFKGLRPTAAIGAHADDAAFSVNFWITPDAANRAPGAGGLRVCRRPPPAEWRIAGYDQDETRIAAFLAAHAGETVVVPYRDNRAALFDSRLFHRSDAPDFAPDYALHRINITLLYGRRAGS
ncbi:MAG: tetratricopeptide repeat protein [Alphaproteobacteria bacterium]|nr:tetratricopeptide repeat protein [Alphaproteobacteria bacterium]